MKSPIASHLNQREPLPIIQPFQLIVLLHLGMFRTSFVRNHQYNIRVHWLFLLSHPARGGWIEKGMLYQDIARNMSHPARGGWMIDYNIKCNSGKE